MALTVVGIFDNATQAQQAVEALVNKGISRDNIDLSASRDSEGSNTGMTGSTNNTGAIIPDRHTNTSGTMTEEVVDDTKDVGSSIGNFFSSLFGDDNDDDHRRYATVAERGSVVTVHAQTEAEAEDAADILDDNGAVDVDERAAQYGYGATSANMTDTTRPAVTDGDQTLKVIEENLEVGKRTVETGGVRLRSRIIEKPVEESVRLREERVVVQRNPVNRPASTADLDAFKEGQIELTEHAERAVVSKTANVVEEITVGKTVSERDEVVRDTVRKTEVDVEQLGNTEQTTRPASGDQSTDTDVTYSTK
ncbi:DUF2382 domain-containing protein [Fibrella sp. HMF5335]|uniref:DUF2382 domain-containing protein n=1 Tax=Fibrella rubiginis TaxID=2817060 RepID=A0A939GCF1_9BACT|nr:YsnF/AvaK domain-containing protein [Fibrella rubiginis]MBO0936507.1 DUF2382 domain-containing protein [Fibrella rubiginis]